MRKVQMMILSILLIAALSFVSVNAINISQRPTVTWTNLQQTIQQSGKMESTIPVEVTWTEDDLLEDGFIKVGQTNELSLYLKRSILNIAIVDHRSNYIWFGYYPDYKTKGYSNSVRQLIESGITIDYAEAISLNEARMSLTSPDAGTVIQYEYINQGFIASVNMVRLGISFELHVSIEKDELNVNLPYQSITEVPYQTAAMRFPREYKLMSVMVFPYLGANNFDINAYAFVPDGSGALIRYEDIPYNSAYIRRIYGRDLGIQTQVTSLGHLKEEPPVSLPIFGINHGYQQAAFLAEVRSGFGSMELHAYPYLYNNLDLNRTFFMYRTRDRSLIRLSGGQTQTITIINKDPYPYDYEVSYAFLSNEEASYSGMANRYRSHLGLDQVIVDSEIDLHMEVIGLDDKPSLIGKSTVKLTTYQDLVSMTDELLEDIPKLHVTYRSYNRNGFFGRQSNQFKLSSALGGRRGFNHLMTHVNEHDNLSLSIYHDPLVTPHQRAFQTSLRRTTLDMFYTPIQSSRINQAYLMTITGISERVMQNHQSYQKHQINALSIESVGQLSFSYQLGQKTIYRESMIDEMMLELEALHDYELGLYRPHDYLFNYMDRYYDMMYQSNLYSFMTDSIPFISMVLSGHVKLYTPHLNYVSDLDHMALKMIEYNLRPSFITTQAPGYQLRHTNYEYLFTTEFDLWKSSMIEQYHRVSPYLNQVIGANILSHRYVTDDLVEVSYDNGVILYINYGQTTYQALDFIVNPRSAAVKGGTS
jgi:hypothetical protein